MKIASLFLCATVIVLASTSCGKHSWKETQVLHEKYQHHDAPHGDAHAGPADHGEKKGH